MKFGVVSGVALIIVSIPTYLYIFFGHLTDNPLGQTSVNIHGVQTSHHPNIKKEVPRTRQKKGVALKVLKNTEDVSRWDEMIIDHFDRQLAEAQYEDPLKANNIEQINDELRTIQ